MGYTHLQTLPNTSTTSFRKNENVDIENHAKCRYIGGCYTSIGLENCVLSFRKTLIGRNSRQKLGCIEIGTVVQPSAARADVYYTCGNPQQQCLYGVQCGEGL
jgi:hypothetical protein